MENLSATSVIPHFLGRGEEVAGSPAAQVARAREPLKR
jgi:hypothetical protein